MIGVEKAGLNIVTGQTSSEMFLWYVVAKCCKEIEKILADDTHPPKNLTLSFRNSTDEALGTTCAQLRFEDRNTSAPQVLPAQVLANAYFPEFEHWWVAMRLKCAAQVQFGCHRAAAMSPPGLTADFGLPGAVSADQCRGVGKFVSGSSRPYMVCR
jgi:hypothetical protein